MPSFHEEFDSRSDAVAWCANAIAAETARYTAANASANAGAPAANAIAALSASFTILAVTDLPAPLAGQEPMVRAQVRLDSITRRSTISTLQFRKRDLPAMPIVGGYATVAKTSSSLVEFRARLPSHVSFQTTGSTSIASGVQLQDPRTAKLYVTTASAIGPGLSAPGAAGVLVNEVDNTVPGDVTYGSQLVWCARPPNCQPTVTVDGMQGTGSPLSPVLADPSGALYNVLEGVLLNGNDGSDNPIIQTSGYLSTQVAVAQQTPPAGSGIPTNLLAVGNTIPFQTPLDALVPSGIVRTVNRPVIIGRRTVDGVPVPGTNLVFNDGAQNFSFEVPVDTNADDLLEITLSFSALGFTGPGPAAPPFTGHPTQMIVGSELTISSPPSGVGSVAVVTSVVGGQTYPFPWRSGSWGGAVTWSRDVRRALNGKWAATIFTLPPGS